MVFAWTGLALEARHAGATGALAAMFLLVAPLEEALKVLVVWPFYSTRRISSPRLGLSYAASAGAGFACAESVAAGITAPVDGIGALRIVMGVPAHLFFAGAWGYALGSGRGARGGWFSVVWFFAMLLHGLYDHIVFGRGAGLLVMVVPLLVAMSLASWIALRDVAPGGSSLPASLRPSLLRSMPEPPSFGALRGALRHPDRPLMLHWIAIGTLVTLGIMIVLLVAAVFVGHRIGVDFAAADEADMRSSGPLLLLGAAVLAAFPLAGYLVARASAATSVLEPALGAGLAIAAMVAMLSLAAPIAVVFALAVAPVAFGLACSGAWFGLVR
jgi:hypothetical protein